MFITGFDKFACIGESISCMVDGFHCVATLIADNDRTPPWERAEGCGVVTPWVTRAKKPGERVLNRDGSSYRFFDYAETIREAKRDGWGPREKFNGESERQRTARAVQEAWRFLKSWCDDEWHYVGIVVTVSREEIELGAARTYGLECNAPASDNSHLLEAANEVLTEALANARDKLAKLVTGSVDG